MLVLKPGRGQSGGMAENGDNVHDLNHKTLQNIQQRLGGVEQRMTGMDERLAGVEQRMTGLEQVQADTLHLLRDVAASVETMSQKISETLDKVTKVQQLTGSRLDIVDQRLAAIEEHTGMFRA
jgi:septal ring factor EnvC (AmiA/AmiB activator)